MQFPSASSSPDGQHSHTERAAVLSVVTGACVLGLKTVAWWVTGSVALGSDALESIVNVVAAGVMWFALRVARRPPDANHPFGHGKAEYVSAVLEGVLIVVAAVAIVREAWPRIWHPVAPHAVGVGALISGVASACNAALGVYLVRVGRARKSPALEGDGMHVLSDVVTSVGVLVGIGAATLTRWWWLDGALATLVAVNILWMGWGIVRRSVGGLMDEVTDPVEAEALRALITREASARGAVEVRAVRFRRVGAKGFCDLRLVVPGAMSVAEAHALCDHVEARVQGDHPGVEVVIHVEPATA